MKARARKAAPPPAGVERQRIPPLRGKSSSDREAYRTLKAMIIERQLLPGDKIRQSNIAASIGVSRTSVLHALKVLESEMLMEFIPRQGCFVRQFSKLEMISIFDLREVLEGLAARKAAECISDNEADQLRDFFRAFAGQERITDLRAYAREDRAFHAFLLNIGTTEFLRRLLETYNVITFSYQHVLTEGLVRPPEKTLGEHLAIIDAICRRQPLEAEALMRTHVRNAVSDLKSAVQAEEARAHR